MSQMLWLMGWMVFWGQYLWETTIYFWYISRCLKDQLVIPHCCSLPDRIVMDNNDKDPLPLAVVSRIRRSFFLQPYTQSGSVASASLSSCISNTQETHTRESEILI